MGYCKRVQMDCIYTDRDNRDNCSLDACKYNIEISYKADDSFKTKPIKTKIKTTTKTTKKDEKDGKQ